MLQMTSTDTAKAYEELVNAIVKAVPDIMGRRNFGQIEPDVTLEDVLRAIDNKGSWWSVDCLGKFYAPDSMENGESWLLGKPLSEQSEETIAFLHNLLCSK